MSVVSLQFGQCGNQIGNSLYSTINEDLSSKNNSHYYEQAVNKWFEVNKFGKWEPRSVLIDTECKVIQSAKPLPFKFKNVIAKSFGGSANNWACGYTKNGPSLANEVINVVRSEVEKCDLLNSFLNICSSSGGTGSGVGSFIVEQLRDLYPNKYIVNVVILPYIRGEVVTQNYNSLLSLTHLQSLADSTILYENERLHYSCKYALNQEDIRFPDMNTIIAQQLAAVCQPVNAQTSSVLNDLTCHPSFKLLQVRSEPLVSKENVKFEGTRMWKSLLTSALKQSRFDVTYQKNSKIKYKTISNAVITRGIDRPTEGDLKVLKQSDVHVSWLPSEESFKTYHERQNFLNFDRHLVAVSNGNSVYVPLNMIAEDAWNLFNYGAYLHHYKKYGVDEECFLNSFQLLENILHAYKHI